MTSCLILASRQPAQCKCRWCGSWGRLSTGCKVTEEMREAIRYYAAKNGRSWRSKLTTEWANGSEELRDVRNAIGPSGLYAIKARL